MSHSRFLTSVHPATVLITVMVDPALVERVESAGSVGESNATGDVSGVWRTANRSQTRTATAFGGLR
jgi:hypothetical protein